jgi:hypothetical protein
MIVTSAFAGPIDLTFAVRLSGDVQNHPESTAVALSTWAFNGTTIGTFSSPESFGTTFMWTAPAPVGAGSIFMLSGRVNASASDYHGHAEIAAELISVTAMDKSGAVVSAEVLFVPESGTVVLTACGITAVILRRRYLLH